MRCHLHAYTSRGQYDPSSPGALFPLCSEEDEEDEDGREEEEEEEEEEREGEREGERERSIAIGCSLVMIVWHFIDLL